MRLTLGLSLGKHSRRQSAVPGETGFLTFGENGITFGSDFLTFGL